MNMKNRYVNYFSARSSTGNMHYSVIKWDDVVKHATFITDFIFTPDELKSW